VLIFAILFWSVNWHGHHVVHTCQVLHTSSGIFVSGKSMIALVCHYDREAENCHLFLAWKKSVAYCPVLKISNTGFYSQQFTAQGSEYQKRFG